MQPTGRDRADRPGVLVALVIVLGLTLTGCSWGPSNGPSGAPLRTAAPGPNGAAVLCTPGALSPFRVHIDLDRGDPTWGEWLNSGEAFAIVWPDTFSLVTSPGLVIADGDGNVVLRDGETIRDGTGNAGDGTLKVVVLCGLGDRLYRMTEGQRR